MLLNQFLTKCYTQGWLGPEETKNGFLKIAKPYKEIKAYKYYNDNGTVRSTHYHNYRVDYQLLAYYVNVQKILNVLNNMN